MVEFSESATAKQGEVIQVLRDMVGSYQLFNKAGVVQQYTKMVQEIFKSCRLSLEEAVKLEDYDEVGHIPLSAMKEAFSMLDVDVSDELQDFIYYIVYCKSDSSQQLKYKVLFDLVQGRGQSAGKSAGRPESSNPA